MNILERRLFKEQIRKELMDELLAYRVAWANDGNIIATRNSSDWNGHVFVIPDDKYEELLG